jgi:hypothetical protein
MKLQEWCQRIKVNVPSVLADEVFATNLEDIIADSETCSLEMDAETHTVDDVLTGFRTAQGAISSNDQALKRLRQEIGIAVRLLRSLEFFGLARFRAPSGRKPARKVAHFNGRLRSTVHVQNGKILTVDGEDLIVQKSREVRHPKKLMHIFNGAIEHGPDAGCDLCDRARLLKVTPKEAIKKRKVA